MDEARVNEVVRKALDTFGWHLLGKVYVYMKYKHKKELERMISESIGFALSEIEKCDDFDPTTLNLIKERFQETLIHVIP